MTNIPCPHCGSPVTVRGNRWECDWCGDFGALSSLRPAERAKLIRAKNQSQQVEFLATVSDRTRPEAKKSSATEDTV